MRAEKKNPGELPTIDTSKSDGVEPARPPEARFTAQIEGFGKSQNSRVTDFAGSIAPDMSIPCVFPNHSRASFFSLGGGSLPDKSAPEEKARPCPVQTSTLEDSVILLLDQSARLVRLMMVIILVLFFGSECCFLEETER